MTLSQEILVLDFGDEKQSEFLKSDASIDFNEVGMYNPLIKFFCFCFFYQTKNKFQSERMKKKKIIFRYRQNGDHCRALSIKNICACTWCHMCTSRPALYLHHTLLLHEKMVVAA